MARASQVELSIEAGETEYEDDAKKGDKGGARRSIVQQARQSRQRQVRLDQLPEASLMVVQHASDPRLAGKLQIRGDPSSLMML